MKTGYSQSPERGARKRYVLCFQLNVVFRLPKLDGDIARSAESSFVPTAAPPLDKFPTGWRDPTERPEELTGIAFGRTVDRLITCAAYWIIASRYHTGQWTKGYAKLSQLSRIGYNPGLASWENQRGSEQRTAAARLLARRRREIRLEW